MENKKVSKFLEKLIINLFVIPFVLDVCFILPILFLFSLFLYYHSDVFTILIFDFVIICLLSEFCGLLYFKFQKQRLFLAPVIYAGFFPVKVSRFSIDAGVPQFMNFTCLSLLLIIGFLLYIIIKGKQTKVL